MKLTALRLTNFRQHVDSQFVFEAGLIGIIGPNGAGKTTVLEAIAWALYGQAAARGNRDSIRFVRAAPRASVRVELDFELGGHRYRVVRGLNSAEVYLDDGAEPIANSISAVSEMMQRRLGMTRTEFFHTYFTGQKELNVMSTMGAAERGRFLSRVLGYDRLRVAQDLVKGRKQAVSHELTGLRAGMPDHDSVIRTLDDTRQRLIKADQELESATSAHQVARVRLDELSPNWQQMQATRDRFQELAGELRVIDSERSAQLRDVERLTTELTHMTAAKVELQRVLSELSPLSSVPEEFSRFEALLREEGRRQTLTDTLRALREEVTQKEERLAVLTDSSEREEEAIELVERQRRELDDVAGQLEFNRTTWIRDRQDVETKRQALRDQYKELKKERDAFVERGEDALCPTCQRPLGDSFRALLDQLDLQMENVIEDGRYFKQRYEQLEHMPPDLVALQARREELKRAASEAEQRLTRLRSEVAEMSALSRELQTKRTRVVQLQTELDAIPVGYDAAQHARVREQAARLAPLNESATRLTTLLEREPAMLTEQSRARQECDRLEHAATAVREAQASMKFSEQDYVTLRAQQEAASETAQQAEVALARVRSDRANAERAVHVAEKAEGELRRTQARVDELVSERKLHEELDRAYSDLRTDLNYRLRPELSELASAFLSDLTDHRYSELELDDGYNIVVLDEGRPKPVISGGEEDLANLVLRLAISQMIAERSGQALSLLVLDEVFGSLDTVRRINVVGLLRRLQDRFEQVILITHVEEIGVREGLDRVFAVDFDQETGASVVTIGAPSFEPPEEFDLPAFAGAGADL